MVVDVGVKPPREKSYLGDAVYVEFDGHYYVLTTSNGISDTNVIYLDSGMVNNLNDYAQKKGVYK